MASQKEIETFQKDGVVCLRKVFSEYWMERIAQGIKETLANPSQYSENLRAEGGPGYYFNDYCNWQKIEAFREVVFKSPVAEIAAQLMQSEVGSFNNIINHLREV